jgi:hypothetical protein
MDSVTVVFVINFLPVVHELSVMMKKVWILENPVTVMVVLFPKLVIERIGDVLFVASCALMILSMQKIVVIFPGF